MAGLPDEMTMVILLHLPAKSLVRFRCVCKSWNSLLTSTSFIEAYHDRSFEFSNKYLLKYDSNHSSRVAIYDLDSHLLSNLDPSLDLYKDTYNLVGSSNGIVCLSTYCQNNYTRLIFLWNPSTNELRCLPQPRFFVSELIGFGFDPSSSGGRLGNFKVVNLVTECGFFKNRCSQVEVYSLRRNSWKLIGNVFPSGIDLKCLGNQVVFGNFVCWSYQYDALLVLFDLVEEVFHRMVLPRSMCAVTEHISMLDGCLSLIAWKPSCHTREVWIMKEFGVVETWTRLYTIDLSITSSPVSRYSTLGFAGSRGILFIKSSSSFQNVVLYNVETAQFEELQLKVVSVQGCRLVAYTQSLVSLVNTQDN